jgi:hypothetical protein
VTRTNNWNDARAEKLVGEIERNGFGILPDFVNPEQLQAMQAFVNEAVRKSDGAYAGFTGPDEVAGSGLDTLARSETFRELVECIYERGTGRPAPKQDYYQILRCLTGRSAAPHSYIFHYDSYVLTVLVPVAIPTEGQRGDLIMLPNFRRLRSTYLANIIDKLLLDNPATQKLLRWLHRRKKLKITRLALQPGSAYFFWGYRSIHTNEPCDMGHIRATALFHYANPHAESWLYRRRFSGAAAN